MTKDEKIIVYHDNDFKRLFNVDKKIISVLDNVSLEIEKGDFLVSINNEEIFDVLDYDFLIKDENFLFYRFSAIVDATLRRLLGGSGRTTYYIWRDARHWAYIPRQSPMT